MSALFQKFNSGIRIGAIADLTALGALTGMQAGSLVWVTSEAKFYQYNGSSWTTVQTEASVVFNDSTFRIQDDGDATKQIAFQASGLSTATTRTILMPDADVDLGNLTNANIDASAAIAYSKLAALTADRALVSDGSGFVSASAVTSTELGYLSGVTSSIQTQLNSASSAASSAQADATQALADAAAAQSDIDAHLDGGASKHDASEIDVEAADGANHSQADLETVIGELDDAIEARATYGDLISNTNGLGASLIGIEDAGLLFTSTNVEGALDEAMDAAQAAQTDATQALSDAATAQSTIDTHLDGGANKHDASEIDFETAAIPNVSVGSVEVAISDLGNAIGDRSAYSEQNYVTNAQTLVASIDALDVQVKDNADAIAAIDLSPYLRHDGTVAMTGALNLDGNDLNGLSNLNAKTGQFLWIRGDNTNQGVEIDNGPGAESSLYMDSTSVQLAAQGSIELNSNTAASRLFLQASGIALLKGNSELQLDSTALRLNSNTPAGTIYAQSNMTFSNGLTVQFGSSSTIGFANNRLQNVGDPVASSDAATKAYVDANIEGLKPKEAVRVATTAAGTLASDFEDGDIVDGVTLTTGDRILIKNQASASENGIYVVAASGAPTRATDFDSLTPIDEVNGSMIPVQEGTSNAGKIFVQTGTVATINTDPINFVFFNSSSSLVGGDGITVSGSNISVDHDGQGLDFVANQLTLELDGSTLSKSASGLKVADGGIADAQIDAAAAISRSKLAAGSANHVIINDGSGNLSSEAVLDVTRGGTGNADRTLSDASLATSIDWQNRQLVDSSSNPVLDWSGPAVKRSNDGSNFVEEEYIDAASLSANVASPTAISALTFAHASFEGCEVTYKIKEATTNRVRIGTLKVVTNGTDISYTDSYNETAVLGAGSGLELTAAINGANVEIRYNNTHASNAATMRADVKRIRA